MSFLHKLQISSLRILHEVILQPSPHVNIFLGPNGSGKTSVLEAVHLLGLGRSFRSRQLRPLVEEGEQAAVVYGSLDDGSSIGISKSLAGGQTIKLNGQDVRSAVDLALRLPLQLINSETFQLLEGGPQERRRFLDWGVFHVEHSFHVAWNKLRASVQHRNALLRKASPSSELRPWEAEIAKNGEEIDEAREKYIAAYLPELRAALSELLPDLDIQVHYERGWKESLTLFEALIANEERDRRYGFTTAGPHRAELRVMERGLPAIDRLSRGQLKLLVSALKLAQARLLQQKRHMKCLFLVDDLPSELDAGNRARVLDSLQSLGGQIFFTAVDDAGLPPTLSDAQMFHVKHGKIAATQV